MNITDNLISINPMTRPGDRLTSVKKIVVHYVGNPNTTALANRNYFESLSNQTEKYASAHYIIGLQGEIIRCVPENEVSWHSGNLEMNYNSIGIENCHPDSSGKFSDITLNSLYELLADLCKKYNLNPTTDIIRHYDVIGKSCPKYYVENVAEWENIKNTVVKKMSEMSTPTNPPAQVYKKYIVTPTIGLNCRQYPTTNSKIITVYKYNSVIEIGEVSNGWGKTKDGWVSMGYVREGTLSLTKYIVIPTIGLNCRQEPNIKSKIITAYKYNSVIEISEVSNEWGKTKDGWVNMKYVKMI